MKKNRNDVSSIHRAIRWVAVALTIWFLLTLRIGCGQEYNPYSYSYPPPITPEPVPEAPQIYVLEALEGFNVVLDSVVWKKITISKTARRNGWTYTFVFPADSDFVELRIDNFGESIFDYAVEDNFVDIGPARSIMVRGHGLIKFTRNRNMFGY